MRLILGFLAAMGAGVLSGQSLIGPTADRLLGNPALRGAQMGISVLDIKTGDIVFEHQGDVALIPASNMKLLTTGAAWKVLGPSWRFPTVLGLYGEVRDSVLYGEVRIMGSGDPGLGSGRYDPASDADSLLARWTRLVAASGIRAIQGRFRVVPRRFPGSAVATTWEWSDLGSCYGQGQWPVNWKENCLRASLQRQSVGWVLVQDSLRIPYTVVHELTTGGSREPAYSRVVPESPTIVIGAPSDLPLPVAVRVADPDPAVTLERDVRAAFQTGGIVWTEAGPDSDSLVLWKSDTVWSLPLKDWMPAINADSRNLHAECLLRAMGGIRKGMPTPEAGIRVLREWLQDMDMGHHPVALYDGSGMSRHNGLTTRFLAELLAGMARRGEEYAEWRQTLARPGQPGTLGSALTDRHLRDKVWAKSGSLNRVRGLSGYLETRKGDLLAFSIIVNQFAGQPSEFYAICQQLLLALQTYQQE
ncbi:MAG: D-alanyl-D-alanine carboxypeptidase/D-alanyl-D-alanine-endopeptidase [Saprospiraceae bacterium]|nr:D-alanyl-D-alanine carboxypeptidase/D-alanyl-D-alanine-endopeptidase [Saprospiraceae bacterium]